MIPSLIQSFQSDTGGPRLPFFLRRMTVSRVFWDSVQENLPTLTTHPGYIHLFWYLILGRWTDKHTHRLLLSSKVISRFEGRSESNTRAEDFLIRFRRDVLPADATLLWSGYNPRRQKCRQLVTLHFGAFQEMVEGERNRLWHYLGRVYLDGTQFSDAKERSNRLTRQHVAGERGGNCDHAKDIQDYLNNLNPHLFTRAIKRNFDDALGAASYLGDSTVREEQDRLLRSIETQPQPFYSATRAGNTVRLFSTDGMPNLQGGVRRALSQGWLEADLKCSQLAICAWLWKSEDINSFLRSRVNVWNYLMDDMGIMPEDRKAAKRVTKEGLYSICYGMEECNIPGMMALGFAKVGLNKNYYRGFLKNSLIRTLIDVREPQLKVLERNGGAETCYGKWCPVTDDRLARDVMAELAQAWEMKFIYPAFELARGARDFTITLYQFDGFSVHFTQKQDMWIKRISESVNGELKKYNVLSYLEWEK